MHYANMLRAQFQRHASHDSNLALLAWPSEGMESGGMGDGGIQEALNV